MCHETEILHRGPAVRAAIGCGAEVVAAVEAEAELASLGATTVRTGEQPVCGSDREEQSEKPVRCGDEEYLPRLSALDDVPDAKPKAGPPAPGRSVVAEQGGTHYANHRGSRTRMQPVTAVGSSARDAHDHASTGG